MTITNCRSASQLLGARGALDSLSMRELFALFVFLLTRGTAEDSVMAIGDVCPKIEELKTSTVDLAGMSKKQFMQALINSVPDDWWEVDGTPLTVSQIRAYLCCTRCMTEDQLKGITIYLLCRFSREFTFTPET